MLQKQTVEPSTFAILEKLMSIQELEEYALVGGTALALYYGHRISVDIDLFSNKPAKKETIADSMTKHFGANFVYEIDHTSPGVFVILKM